MNTLRIYFVNNASIAPIEFFEFMQEARKTGMRFDELCVINTEIVNDVSYMKPNFVFKNVEFFNGFSDIKKFRAEDIGRMPMYFRKKIIPLCELTNSNSFEPKLLTEETINEFLSNKFLEDIITILTEQHNTTSVEPSKPKEEIVESKEVQEQSEPIKIEVQNEPIVEETEVKPEEIEEPEEKKETVKPKRGIQPKRIKISK